MQPKHSAVSPIPTDTYQTAREIYNLEHIYLRIGDQLTQTILPEINLARLNPFLELDATTVSRLSLVTAFQYAESIPDETASNATRKRIDWKYALHLPLHHQGVSSTLLCTFRQNIYESQHAQQEFTRFLDQLLRIGLYPTEALGSIAAKTVLHTVCKVNRLFLLDKSMRGALGMITMQDPDWLRSNARPHWFERFKTGSLNRILDQRTAEEEAARMCADIAYLLCALQQQNKTSLYQQAEIQSLERLWNDQFVRFDGATQWRLPGCASCSSNHTPAKPA